ncbi:MAG: 2-amino-4-hydroxy-6-hydroxymethyldihydropteridine diphosphokinase [Magnetococcales bacterium]|nr:2-amino-4-hydroxy-6-hydroxymethyldihydropteridine diphosphokinase [Magnetococcales bacterium]
MAYQGGEQLISPTVAWIGFGANLGDLEQTFARVLAALRDFPSEVVACSSLYRTQPVGFLDQPWFLNAVIGLKWQGPHRNLWRFLADLERDLGRRREGAVRWGPRMVDLDLLLFGDQVIREPDLIVPHPRLCCRRFVLQPLAEVAGRVRHPVSGKTVDTLLEEVNDHALVERVPPLALTGPPRTAGTDVSGLLL